MKKICLLSNKQLPKKEKYKMEQHNLEKIYTKLDNRRDNATDLIRRIEESKFVIEMIDSTIIGGPLVPNKFKNMDSFISIKNEQILMLEQLLAKYQKAIKLQYALT